MAVNRCAQTLMARLSVPVEMGTALSTMGGVVKVNCLHVRQLSKQYNH